jgi:hypothetical protein
MSAEAPQYSAITTSVDRQRLHDVYAQTPAGEYLSQRARYDAYRPASTSVEEWQDLLGADVNNLDHMLVTVQVASTFLRLSRMQETPNTASPFSTDDENDLLLAAAIHDWGEGVEGCEDIIWRKKTKDDDLRERDAMHIVVQDVAARYSDDEHEKADVLSQLERVADEIVFNRESRLGRAFDAIERVGYLRTAVRSWREQADVKNSDMMDTLQWISADVLALHTIPLLSHSQDHFPVLAMLAQNESQISDAFASMPDSIFEMYDEDEKEQMREKFRSAKTAWGSPDTVIHLEKEV